MVENAYLASLFPEWTAAVLFAVSLLAEWIHAGRVNRVSILAFGDTQKPSLWARQVPWFRPVMVAALGWGLMTLLLCEPMTHLSANSVAPGKEQHMVVVLDVSPSMRLKDAGALRTQSRTQRAREVMRSLFGRIPIDKYLVSVIAVYNGAKPVVVDSRDLDVVDGILGDIPLSQGFKPGQTKLLEGLEEAVKVAKPWNPGSATIVLISDGDTVPSQGMPEMPASVAHVLVVGIGDPNQGTFIDGRHSKQDQYTLKQIATRLRGSYHDGNSSHVPGQMVGSIVATAEANWKVSWTRREIALLLAGLGGFSLAFLPIALSRFGTVYQPGIRFRNQKGNRNDNRLKSRVAMPSSLDRSEYLY